MIETLSRSIVKAADRVGGCDLILPWPPGLPPGAPLDLDEERDATPREKAAAERLIGPAARDAGLVPVRVLVATLRRPNAPDMPRPGAVEQHLIVRLIGRRWVHASISQHPPDKWWPGELV